MKKSEDCRNFVVAGHAGSGKTSLCDLMLYKAKAVDRLGSVPNKTSISDFLFFSYRNVSHPSKYIAFCLRNMRQNMHLIHRIHKT